MPTNIAVSILFPIESSKMFLAMLLGEQVVEPSSESVGLSPGGGGGFAYEAGQPISDPWDLPLNKTQVSSDDSSIPVNDISGRKSFDFVDCLI